ncbi:MLO-like protein 4 [Linum grandiflorum]
MGHWLALVAKICVKTTYLNSRFYFCDLKKASNLDRMAASVSHQMNNTVVRAEFHSDSIRGHCPPGHESFASHDSLEQLHRLMFVLAVTHVSYSFAAIALAMIKIYSWRSWENQAKSLALQSFEDSFEASSHKRKMGRISTFILHHTTHPWSQHKFLVWVLCFSRQFWTSITNADYMALRLGFITTHQLPLVYDFHNYMLRSMEEEFSDIVGISLPLWFYAIVCVFLDFHGTEIYFWLSFLPVILVLVIGTKLHRIVVRLAVEIRDACQTSGHHRFNLRDELFWFRKPRLLLWLIQLVSFQNAFEMATFLWSLWEVKDTSCFMSNKSFVIVRLVSGVVSQIWCSFITFPLYVIVTQMGGRFKRTVVSENVWRSLHGWQRRVKARRSPYSQLESDRVTIRTSSSRASSSRKLQRKSNGSSKRTERANSKSRRLEEQQLSEASLLHHQLDPSSSPPTETNSNYASGRVVAYDDNSTDEIVELPICSQPPSSRLSEDHFFSYRSDDNDYDDNDEHGYETDSTVPPYDSYSYYDIDEEY